MTTTAQKKTPQEEANILRQEAKDNLLGMFKIPEGFSSGSVERIVDSIISCAIIEITIIMEEAVASLPKNN